MTILRYSTNKLFYNKWIYKIVVRVRRRNHQYNYFSFYPYSKVSAESEDVSIPTYLTLRSRLSAEFDHKKYTCRVEGQRASIFCNEKEVLDKIEKLCVDSVVSIYEPESSQEIDVLTNQTRRKVLCKRLPKQLYQFKFHIFPHMGPEAKLSFWEWTTKYDQTKICLTKGTRNWLTKHGYWSSCYGYAADEKTMSMICLYLGSNIRYIEEYVPRDSINSRL